MTKIDRMINKIDRSFAYIFYFYTILALLVLLLCNVSAFFVDSAIWSFHLWLVIITFINIVALISCVKNKSGFVDVLTRILTLPDRL